MKAITNASGHVHPTYETPIIHVLVLECRYIIAGSNTGESFVQETDYDGF